MVIITFGVFTKQIFEKREQSENKDGRYFARTKLKCSSWSIFGVNQNLNFTSIMSFLWLLVKVENIFSNQTNSRDAL